MACGNDPAAELVREILEKKHSQPAYYTKTVIVHDAVEHHSADYIEACRRLRSQGYWCGYEFDGVIPGEPVERLVLSYDKNPVRNFARTYISSFWF